MASGVHDYAKAYGVTEIPTNVLIGPDGTVIHLDLSRKNLAQVVARAVGTIVVVVSSADCTTQCRARADHAPIEIRRQEDVEADPASARRPPAAGGFAAWARES